MSETRERELVERLRLLLKNASPVPWCWQQCGDKCDDPVIGIAWREDDETYAAIPGYLEDFDTEGNAVEYYRESIAFLGDANSPDASASANARLIVEVINALPSIIEALSASTQVDAMREMVEAAYREGWFEGYATGDACGSYNAVENDWLGSDALAALSAQAKTR